MNPNPSTVFIVDDDTEVRHALALLMESVGLHVQTFASADSYLEQFTPQAPGCLILDVRMPGMSGLELQARLEAEAIHPPVIIITGHGDVPMAVRAVQAGAVDFIEKPFNDQSLLDSVHRALDIDARQRGRANKLAEVKARLDTLTPREQQVMKMVVAGKRNKVIALELCVSQSTVEAHRAKVMEKMQAQSLSDLMRMVLSVEDSGE
ncbi:MAG TPA: response regulator transcription factor [Thiolapillus brandeum]|uniref:Response regulator transcription factor n=1 Tax=Thiolapillus brandeum TaxID=1076588 RepID=A0A831KCT7_9GAMM|nr:response regulator transcription factor [Thiolapillus brandeum]